MIPEKYKRITSNTLINGRKRSYSLEQCTISASSSSGKTKFLYKLLKGIQRYRHKWLLVGNLYRTLPQKEVKSVFVLN